ncbi:hypothetical protein PYCC9005_000691 [Savitreella phatthalungensis]
MEKRMLVSALCQVTGGGGAGLEVDFDKIAAELDGKFTPSACRFQLWKLRSKWRSTQASGTTDSPNNHAGARHQALPSPPKKRKQNAPPPTMDADDSEY